MTNTTETTDLHIVVAALESQGHFVGYTAVTGPLTYDKALEIWESKERFKIGINRRHGHVARFAVRSINDPRFAPLVGRGYADAVSTYTDHDGTVRTRLGRQRGCEKAARAWAKLYGYEGRGGGWIYDPSGSPVQQGWFSFAQDLRRRGAIAEGADGRWYVIDRELVQ